MCPNSGNVLLCQSASYACQDDGAGAQKCLPRDDSFLDSVDESTTMPWASCSLSNAKLPSKCLFDFQCNCMDYANVNCYCSPSDAWRTGRKKAENCTTSSGEVGVCDVGKYCRTKDHYQECAVAPYLPRSTSLYSDCTNDNDQLKIFILYSWLRHNNFVCRMSLVKRHMSLLLLVAYTTSVICRIIRTKAKKLRCVHEELDCV
ncbi:unnamed protein product [Peronospora belbahrii]|nr:unnamed protein product [Peronospora belbahrii]CAH0515007.1 unnamed protein product [Peronospora belbahrii]